MTEIYSFPRDESHIFLILLYITTEFAETFKVGQFWDKPKISLND